MNTYNKLKHYIQINIMFSYFREPFSPPIYRLYEMLHSILVYFSCRMRPSKDEDDDDELVLVEWKHELMDR